MKAIFLAAEAREKKKAAGKRKIMNKKNVIPSERYT